MSGFAQRLSRLRCVYSTLRLSRKRNHPQRLVALSRCKFSTMAPSSRIIDADDQKEPSVRQSEVLHENKYARNFFLNSYKYNKSVMQPNLSYVHVTNEEVEQLLNEDWSQKTENELFSAVKRLSYNMHCDPNRINPYRYQNIFNELGNHYHKLNDKDLFALIRRLVSFRNFCNLRFYREFMHLLERECVKRFMNLSTDNMLLLCDMLFEITNDHNCEYIWHAIRKLGNKPQRLESHQLIQVMFFLNVCRKPPINMYELEYCLEQCFEELSINEVGIAALGFFKTGSKIQSSSLLNRIIVQIINNLEDMDNVSIGAVAKLIRYSMQFSAIQHFAELLNKIILIEPRLTLMTLNHIAHASARVTMYHEEFLNRIIKRLNDELTTSRLKELERLVYIFTSFNIDSSNSVYHNVIEELRTSWNTRRAYEIREYPALVSQLLGHLSYMNIYPTDLIERVMQPAFLHAANQKKYATISREYFLLENGLQIEVPQYNGPFLKPYMRDKLLKDCLKAAHSAHSSRANLQLIDVHQTCQEMFNNTSDIILDNPIPHFTTPDVIFCLDEQNRLVPIKDYMRKFQMGEIKWVISEVEKNNRVIALIMGHHGILLRGTELPVGLLAAKIRQLAKIGYTPITVSYIQWKERKTQEEKHNYIRQLLLRNNASEPTM